MTELGFLSDEGFNTIRAMHRIKKVLQREKKEYLRALHTRCGVGLTAEDFDNIVKNLADDKWCSLQVGALGGTLVVLNEPVSTAGLPYEQH